MRLIGIDVSTNARNTGIAVGSLRDALVVESVVLGRNYEHVVQTVAEAVTDDCLIAIDAPLGWPVGMLDGLRGHVAGQPLARSPDEMFHRRTDAVVRSVLGKRPLEVGANLIARAAHHALRLLDDIREASGHDLPLAWQPGESGAIEVYPAATMLSHGIESGAYKRAGTIGASARAAVVEQLAETVTLDVPHDIFTTDDAIDAAVCLLSAADFLSGECLAPTDDATELARREGWIWIRPRHDQTPRFA